MTKFSKAGRLVMDSCSRTFMSAKACMVLSKHRGFIGCKIDAIQFNNLVGVVIWSQKRL